MHDLFPGLTVAYSLAIWIAAAYCGPALGPLMAGYVVPIKGWRWSMWEIVWLAGPVVILLLLLPETHAPTIEAKHQKSTDTDPEKATALNRTRVTTMAQVLRNALVRPIQICIQDPAVVYSTYYTFFDAVPRVYVYNYGFTPGQVGLVFLSVFVACIVAGSAYCLYISRILHPKLESGAWAPYESQLRPALAATFLLPLGLFLFGWTSDGTIHWIASVIGITLYSMGTFIILQCLSVYLPEIYPRYSASLFAANDFCRSTLAAAAIHFAIPLYDDLGIGKGVSVLGGLSVLGVVGMWYIYRAGASLRAKSRFTDSDH
jgi:DHA1 family multidrug resistance protein-like MFS transporter